MNLRAIIIFLLTFLATDLVCAQDSLKELRDRARRGDVSAMRRLAKRLINGDGVDRDTATGAEWMRRSANGGDSGAMLWMGDLHRQGKGVPRNINMAMQYWQAAAKAGNKAARKRLKQYGGEPAVTTPTPAPAPPTPPTEEKEDPRTKALEELEKIGISTKDMNPTLRDKVVLNDKKLVKLLIVAGADVNSKSPKGETALMLAAREQNTILCRLLLEAGADVHAQQSSGKTPLVHAMSREATSQQLDVIKLLLEKNSPVNEPFRLARSLKITPLIFAVTTGDPELVDVLLQAGAHPGATDSQGHTARYWAEKLPGNSNMQEIIERLKEEEEED